jgi:hypothetical protein
VGEQPLPVQVLREMLHMCIPEWLAMKIHEVLQREGISESAADQSVADVVESVSTMLLQQLDDLLLSDPDEQRANPLAVVRSSLQVRIRLSETNLLRLQTRKISSDCLLPLGATLTLGFMNRVSNGERGKQPQF